MDWPTIGRESELAFLESAVSAGQSVLITGEIGSGKSRLMREVMRRAEGRRAGVENIVGFASGTRIPFGAVPHLVGDGAPADRAWLIGSVRAELHRRAGPEGLVVAVDDINLLDDATLTLIQSVTLEGAATMVATVRTEHAGVSPVIGLWKDGLMTRLDVEPLDEESSKSLIESMLDGSISVSLARRIWSIAAGNPLYTTELVTAGRENGTIVRRDRYWDLDEDGLGPTSRLQDVLEGRIRTLQAAERAAFDAVSVAEPVPLAMLESLADAVTVAALERRGLVTVESVNDRVLVRTAHPLFGETARQSMGKLDRTSIIRRLGDSDPDHLVDPGDALRAAAWLLEIGELPPRELSLSAARTALLRFDPALAERLARSAMADGGSAAAHVVLGRALSLLGRYEEAESVLSRALDEADEPQVAAEAGAALAETSIFGLASPERAIAAVERAIAKSHRPEIEAELEALAQLAAGYGGSFERALEDGPALLGRALPPRAEVPLRMTYSLAQSMTGRLDGVLDCIDRGERMAVEVGASHPLARDQLGLTRVLALQAMGRLADSVQAVDDALRVPDFSQRLVAPWLYIGSIAHQLSGDLDTAITHGHESIMLHEKTDPIGTAPLALALTSLCHAMKGESSEAMELADRAHADPRSWPIRTQIWIELARAWISAARGDLEPAADTAAGIGRRALDSWHTVWGAIALHAAVRFGRPHVVARDLAALRDEAGPLVAMLADHASAAAARDPIGLAKVAAEFEQIGAHAVAADARAAEAAHWEDPIAQSRAAIRAHELYRLWPAYVGPLQPSLRVPLSDRQLEVGRAAALGAPTKQIASELFITPKTVDNHLQAIYRSLGMSGREELRQVFLPPESG